MPQPGALTKENITRLTVPALNILRGIHLDLAEHPDCPYRVAASRACDNLLELIALATVTETTDGVQALQSDR